MASCCFLTQHFLATVYAFVLFDVGPVGVLATVGVCLTVAVRTEESEVFKFVVCSVSVDMVYLQIEMGIIVDTDVADSTFVCDEAFVDNSCSDRFVVFCIFREYSFVWFSVDSVEWL